MIYALTISIAAGLLLLVLVALAVAFARRSAESGLPSIGSWRWYPSPLGLLLVLPVAGLLLFRFLPALLAIPLILPLFLRGRRMGRLFFSLWNLGRESRRDAGDDTIEGQSRFLDDE